MSSYNMSSSNYNNKDIKSSNYNNSIVIM